LTREDSILNIVINIVCKMENPMSIVDANNDARLLSFGVDGFSTLLSDD